MTLRSRIKQTLAYSAFFNYPLTSNELHFWLITPKSVSLSELKKNLPQKALHSNIKLRRKKKLLTTQKLQANQKALNFLQSIPTIDLVALTGSLAMDNAKSGDDLDLMIVTKSHTLWLTRLFIIPLFRIFFKTRFPQKQQPQNNDAICLNLWLDTQSLTVPPSKQNLYIAHEVLQIKPIFNRGTTYEHFILNNSWSSSYLANAYKSITLKFTPLPQDTNQDFFLSVFIRLLSLLNFLSFKLQYFYMKPKITREYVTLHSAYFHPRDLSSKISRHLKQRYT